MQPGGRIDQGSDFARNAVTASPARASGTGSAARMMLSCKIERRVPVRGVSSDRSIRYTDRHSSRPYRFPMPDAVRCAVPRFGRVPTLIKSAAGLQVRGTMSLRDRSFRRKSPCWGVPGVPDMGRLPPCGRSGGDSPRHAIGRDAHASGVASIRIREFRTERATVAG